MADALTPTTIISSVGLISLMFGIVKLVIDGRERKERSEREKQQDETRIAVAGLQKDVGHLADADDRLTQEIIGIKDTLRDTAMKGSQGFRDLHVKLDEFKDTVHSALARIEGRLPK